MGHSSLEAGEASEIRVVCIDHLARVRSWLTASEGIGASVDGDPADGAEDVPPRAVTGAPRAARANAIQP